MPVVSRRPFRVLGTSTQHLFKSYRNEVDDHLSRQFFVSNVLSDFRIHYSTGPLSCPYCVGVENDSKKGSGEELEFHKKRDVAQKSVYMQHKRRVSTEKKFLLIVQDFTQILYGSKSAQDLIITVYYHDRTVPLNTSHKFYHFLASSTNDVNFVYSVWKDFFDELLTTYDPRKIMVWSDGGRKHFKTSRQLVMWWELLESRKVKMEYHFFESYHGHNACDGGAAHAKKALVNYQKNNQTIITSIEEVKEVIGNIDNHVSTICDVDEEAAQHISGISFKNIMSCHYFTFDKRGNISGYVDSTGSSLIDTYSVLNKLSKQTKKN